MKLSTSQLLSIALGLCAGFVGALLAPHGQGNAGRAPAGSAASVQASAASAPAQSSGAARASERRLTTLEQQLQALQARGSAEAPALTASPSAAESMPSEVERAHERVAAWERTVSQYSDEPTDAAWAPAAAERLQGDVDRLAEEKGFAVVEASCRSSHCRAVVEWPDFDTAAEQYSVLLHDGGKTGCARETILMPPATPGGSYQQTVLYDCSEDRAGGS